MHFPCTEFVADSGCSLSSDEVLQNFTHFKKAVDRRFHKNFLKDIVKPEIIPAEYWKKVIWVALDLKRAVCENQKRSLSLLEAKHVTMLFVKPHGRFQLAFSLACDLLNARKTLYCDPNFENQNLPGDSGRGIDAFVEKTIHNFAVERKNLWEEEVEKSVGADVKFKAFNERIAGEVREIFRVLSMLSDMFIVHGLHHNVFAKVVAGATVPVFLASSDAYCMQKGLSDMMTYYEVFKHLKGLTLAWVGPPNSIFNSYLVLCSHFGMKLRYTLICSHGSGKMSPVHGAPFHKPDIWNTDFVMQEFKWAKETVEGANIVAISMHPEEENKITLELLKKAAPDYVFMHSLPRGSREVAPGVLNGKNDLTWKTTENYLFMAMGIILTSLKDYTPRGPMPDL